MNSSNHKVYMMSLLIPSDKTDSRIHSFEHFLRYDVNILGFWNYIPFVYCFKSRLHSSVLRSMILPILDTQFILAEVKPENVDGALPQQAWEWFYNPPEERSGVAGLLGALAPTPGGLGLLGSAPPKLGGLFGLGSDKK